MTNVKIGVHNATEDQYNRLVDAGFEETRSGSCAWVDVFVGEIEITTFMPSEMRKEMNDAS